MATNPKGSTFAGRKWRKYDVCLLDNISGHLTGHRVKVMNVLRGGRDIHIRYHIGGHPDEIVHASRLSPLPLNAQP